MTYKELEEVNKQIRATDIKGKDYAEVNQRIKAFRMLYPEGCISTEIVSIENGVCIIKATIMNEWGIVLGTGTAYEKEGSTFINKTSYIENCETSAVGRALGMLGIGIDVSVASYEDVANAIAQQTAEKKITATDVKALKSMIENTPDKLGEDAILKKYKVSDLKELTFSQFKQIADYVNGGK